MLDSAQILSGLSVLLSFFVGYKYGIKMHKSPVEEEVKGEKKMVYSSNGDYKMVLVVRNDLKMGKGKIGSQCAHAAVGAFQTGLKNIPQIVRHWDNSGSAKIAVKVESESELMDIRRQAIIKQFNICLIRDAGRTQIEPNTKTVLAIGPALCSDVDKITGHLKLL